MNRGLTKEILFATKEYCGAVAVSAYKPYSETEQTVSLLREYKIRTNIHYILDSKSVDNAIDWLKSPPEFLSDINAIIFLNYKPSGRKVFEQRLLRHSPRVQEFFDLATSEDAQLKVGFDSCCVSGVFARTKTNTSMVDACDAGRFSLFVSEDMKVYPCSFQTGLKEGDQLTEQNTIKDIWLNSENMKGFRDYFSSNRCSGCSFQKTCKNGCPIFDELVVCGNR